MSLNGKIEQVRFQERLKVVWQLDKSKDIHIPHLSIQPLVKNAINHGVMAKTNGGKVWITVSTKSGYTKITVEDNGVGMNPEQVDALFSEHKRRGVGVLNTNQRLKKYFGEELHVKSEIGQGTTFYFRIPHDTEII